MLTLLPALTVGDWLPDAFTEIVTSVLSLSHPLSTTFKRKVYTPVIKLDTVGVLLAGKSITAAFGPDTCFHS